MLVSPRHLIVGLLQYLLMKKNPINFLEPSQQQLNDLIKYYQTKQYDNAEKLAVSITKEFPKHPFTWKVLAVVLKQNGRIEESLVASKKSVQLNPKDAEAYYLSLIHI